MGRDEPQEHNGDDIVLENDADVHASGKKMRARLKECEKEKNEYLEGWQRAKADLVNLRREYANNELELRCRVTADIIGSLIPALDSFEMAMSSSAWERVDMTWRAGITAIRDQLVAGIAAHGVSFDDPTGLPFDPVRHESVGVEEVDDANQDHVVIRTTQKGVRMDEKIIRPAKVIIGQYRAP